jgi:hypothetical protein
MAYVLVMELASIHGTFVWFHEQITASLDEMMEVLVKEQAVAQRDQFAAFRLLEQIMEALENCHHGRRKSFQQRDGSGSGCHCGCGMGSDPFPE